MMILTQIQIYWKIFSFLGQGRLRTTAHFPRHCPFWYIAPGIRVDVEKTDSLFL